MYTSLFIHSSTISLFSSILSDTARYPSYCSVPIILSKPSKISNALFTFSSDILFISSSLFTASIIWFLHLVDIPVKKCSYSLPTFIRDTTDNGSMIISALTVLPNSSIV